MSVLDAVVITGAGRGLGREAARSLAADGTFVLCIARTESVLETRDSIRAEGGRADAIQLDISKLTEAESRVGEWLLNQSFKRVGFVGAAGTLGKSGGVLDGGLEDWAETFQTNVLGNLAVLRGLLPGMLANRFGRIVMVSGGGAAYAFPKFSGYALSKTATVRATENLDAELKGKGDFHTVCLAPGAMETGMLAQVRAAGAEVRTTVAIEEPVRFIKSFLGAERCGFSGRFVHVRDTWNAHLNGEPVTGERWYLRRFES